VSAARLALLLALLAPAPPAAAGDTPESLVARLGSGRFEGREGAARELERLGPAALPALRAARDAADPEVRQRAAALLERIAFAGAIAPTAVRLDARGRPLAAVVADLAGQSGLPMRLDPRGGDGLAGRPVGLDAPGPLPLWEAVDRLATEARLRIDLRPLPAPDTGEARYTLVLEDAPGRPAPTSTWGAFRVTLRGLVDRREVVLDPVRRPFDEAPGPARTLTGRLLLLAEPRLTIARWGQPRLRVARDDQGRSLLPPAPAGAVAFAAEEEGEEGLLSPQWNGAPEQSYPLPMSSPEAGARRLTVEGTLPVAVAARAPEPLDIPLKDAVGRTFEADDAAVTVSAIGPTTEPGGVAIDLALRPRAEVAAGEAEAAFDGSLIDRQIEAIDAAGRSLPISLRRQKAEGRELRLRAVLEEPPAGGVATVRLRYHRMLRGVVPVPFTFRDIPLP
jgi:hypothetical protein